ncbi:hypothetical protein DEJ00_04025 [Curtobacterium sp. MCLR17_039]|nr:hypothetical protein DEJ00_04025 [Curtobacterium sp. MCLR17_039]
MEERRARPPRRCRRRARAPALRRCRPSRSAATAAGCHADAVRTASCSVGVRGRRARDRSRRGRTRTGRSRPARTGRGRCRPRRRRTAGPPRSSRSRPGSAVWWSCALSLALVLRKTSPRTVPMCRQCASRVSAEHPPRGSGGHVS